MTASFYSLLLLLVPLSFILTVYLYTYPIVHGCGFPQPPKPFNETAPFRLLALGDPQLEGDSSVLRFDNGYFPSFEELQRNLSTADSLRQRISITRHATSKLTSDIGRILASCRKRLDLWGNDYYLGHIYRTIQRVTRPTHVAVLGDLLGSQWISDEEFGSRGQRYWQRVFKGSQKIQSEEMEGIPVETLSQDTRWEQKIINIAGNHDIGYAGDMNQGRIRRFEGTFGKINWETRFTLPSSEAVEVRSSAPELRLIILNSLNLDTPAVDPDLQHETYKFINDAIMASRPVEDRTTATILLTHLPLHKEAGICVDGPFFDFYPAEEGSGVKEQNHLSYDTSKGILEGIFGMSEHHEAPGRGLGRNGVILTGHDHEGCDVYHYIPAVTAQESRSWKAEKWDTVVRLQNRTVPGIREITVRSMMGGFGGNAGLLSAWFDNRSQEWSFDYTTCSVGTQHIWWSIHVLDIATFGLLLLVVADKLLAYMTFSSMTTSPQSRHDKRSKDHPLQGENDHSEALATGKSNPLGLTSSVMQRRQKSHT
ncbi:MAG: hypothetical protein LQ351_004443 [Letrouitia transgressa]|nr:MAG: hypothetical protein LQ351_004443 [Letrouitia transgressa]